GPLAAAKNNETDAAVEGLESYDALLAAVTDGEPGARDTLMALFNEFRGDTVAITALAVDLIGALDGDPVAVIDVASLIADVATATLTTQPIVRVSVGGDMKLPRGAKGWDFGAPDSAVFEGFEHVTTVDQDIVPGAQTALQNPGDEVLLSDGLLDISKFRVEVLGGTYRLILLTDDSGNMTLANPLGESILVNGVRTQLPGGTPDTWEGNGVLGGTFDAGGGNGFGSGVTIITVVVVGGKLELEFLPAAGQSIFLSGLILEPIDGPSVLDMPDFFTDDEEILSAEGFIAEGIGETLEKIATAAGNEGEVEDIIDVDEVATEETSEVSPS
ncbi:MAG: hypothetical protein VCB77_08605, partial [Alphaproteobacteria bacterium]